MDLLQNLMGEFLVVINASLAHQCRIGGKPLDIRLGIHFKHARPLRAISENGNLQVTDFFM
jgi:hypothetical protein